MLHILAFMPSSYHIPILHHKKELQIIRVIIETRITLAAPENLSFLPKNLRCPFFVIRNGIRTRVARVKGESPRPLDDPDFSLQKSQHKRRLRRRAWRKCNTEQAAWQAQIREIQKDVYSSCMKSLHRLAWSILRRLVRLTASHRGRILPFFHCHSESVTDFIPNSRDRRGRDSASSCPFSSSVLVSRAWQATRQGKSGATPRIVPECI